MLKKDPSSCLPKFSWQETPTENGVSQHLRDLFTLSLPVARVLTARGIRSEEEARTFLSPDIAKEFSDPFSLPGIEEATERIWRAVREGERIVVFGDFDVDGVSATVILVKTIHALGGKVSAFIPDRRKEGYGLSHSAIDRCLVETPELRLLVTVDCGIASVREAAYLKDKSIDMILTDHHEPEGELPEVCARVDPRVENLLPETANLCGAGVAFKLAHALVNRGRARDWYTGKNLAGGLLPAAGLATVADLVPLTGENRLLVKGALACWNKAAPVGLRTLLRHVSRKAEPPNASTFGFLLGPCINAAGRMDSAMLAYELLATDDVNLANERAIRLKDLNAARKTTEARILADAREQAGIPEDGTASSVPAIVVCHATSFLAGAEDTGWHPGVIGIVASRLCEIAGRPAAVVALDGVDPAHDGGRGSLRACEGYDAMRALADAAEALEEYGGHALAAGFTLRPGQFDRFKDLFCASCARQAGERGAVRRTLAVDGWLEPEEITLELEREIQRLAPFGYGNPVPCWGIRGVTLRDVKALGNAGDTLALSLEKDGKALPRAVWFRQGALLETLRAVHTADIAVQLKEDDYSGEAKVELGMVDLAPL